MKTSVSWLGARFSPPIDDCHGEVTDPSENPGSKVLVVDDEDEEVADVG